MWVPAWIAIRELAEAGDSHGLQGEIEWDSTKPDGTPKQLDVSRISSLGWQSRISLAEGLEALSPCSARRGSAAPAAIGMEPNSVLQTM